MISWLRAAAARLFPPRVDTTPELAAVEAEIADPWAAEVVRRALSVEGTGRYGLGCGGRDPSAPSPLDKNGRSDCSGFALAWCYGWDRYAPGLIDADWHSTAGVFADATGPQRVWRALPIDDARPGHALVYPTRRVAGVKRIGHCGVVVGPNEIVHCHGGRGPAISRATFDLWRRKKAIAVVPVSWD